ncbi:hypothetical protein BGZ80_005485, partial [Entomortierella chlamydospora]
QQKTAREEKTDADADNIDQPIADGAIINNNKAIAILDCAVVNNEGVIIYSDGIVKKPGEPEMEVHYQEEGKLQPTSFSAWTCAVVEEKDKENTTSSKKAAKSAALSTDVKK